MDKNYLDQGTTILLPENKLPTIRKSSLAWNSKCFFASRLGGFNYRRGGGGGGGAQKEGWNFQFAQRIIMSESAKRPPSPNSPPEVENKEEGGMFLTPVAAAPEKKRCSRNSTFVVQGNSSPSKDKSSGDEIVLLLFSKIVRGSLELIWCERNSGEVDGFTDPLAKAITEDEHSSSSQSTTGKNVAHRHGIFMYGSRVKPGNRTLWMNVKGYPRRFYIRQMRDGDDRLAVLNDVCQVRRLHPDNRKATIGTNSTILFLVFRCD